MGTKMMNKLRKMTRYNKILWAITFLIWSIVVVQWVSNNIDAETGEKIYERN